MSYLVARMGGPNNKDVTFQQLGNATGEAVTPARTKFTGLFDAEGNPIHRPQEARQKMGFCIS